VDIPHSLEKAARPQSYRNYHSHVRTSVFDIPPFSLTAHSRALAFCIPVLPTSMERLFLIIHDDDKLSGTPVTQFVLKTIFSLSGVADVLVFYIARDRYLLLFDSPLPQLNVTPLADIQLGSDHDLAGNLGEQMQNEEMSVASDLHQPMPDEGVPVNNGRRVHFASGKRVCTY
jgi:hypothetical protein